MINLIDNHVEIDIFIKTMKLLQKILLLAVILGFLSACGQTGDLYMPKKDDVATDEGKSGDIDPSNPDKAEIQTTSSLVDSGEGTNFTNSKSDASSAAGGNPNF
jgi:predicted small lipoprotein YifL